MIEKTKVKKNFNIILIFLLQNVIIYKNKFTKENLIKFFINIIKKDL